MNSLGSSSKWPSYDSLPSTSSCLHSEGEQTDDETEFVSEGEVDSGTSKSLSPGGGRYLELNEPHVRSDGDHQHEPQTDRSLHSSSASPPATAPLDSSSATPGDLVFAQKCVNLRRFVRPLLGLLHGLKTGRFDKGLSRFQQSVATDRLQRILGILQRPDMGEKYLQNLLQIEVMLKMWFPQVAARSAEEPSQTTIPRVRPQWQHNQLHMPVKKRKLSWSGHEYPEKVPAKRQQHEHGKTGSCEADAAFIPESPENLKAGEPAAPAQGSCTDGPKFTDSSSSRNRPPYLGSNRENDNQRRSELSPTSHCDRAAAQDSSVSSSDSFTKSYTP